MSFPIDKSEAPINYSSSQDEYEDEIDLRELLGTLIEGKWVIVLVVIAALFLVLLRPILIDQYSAPMCCCKSSTLR